MENIHMLLWDMKNLNKDQLSDIEQRLNLDNPIDFDIFKKYLKYNKIVIYPVYVADFGYSNHKGYSYGEYNSTFNLLNLDNSNLDLETFNNFFYEFKPNLLMIKDELKEKYLSKYPFGSYTEFKLDYFKLL